MTELYSNEGEEIGSAGVDHIVRSGPAPRAGKDFSRVPPCNDIEGARRKISPGVSSGGLPFSAPVAEVALLRDSSKQMVDFLIASGQNARSGERNYNVISMM
jgi:hypothetical protein